MSDGANKCGTLVVTVLGEIEGMITAECHRFDKVTYEISYFDGRDPKDIWMHEKQFKEKGNPEPFGFIIPTK